MKSCKRFSHLSTFSDSNGFMMVGPDVLTSASFIIVLHTKPHISFFENGSNGHVYVLLC